MLETTTRKTFHQFVLARLRGAPAGTQMLLRRVPHGVQFEGRGVGCLLLGGDFDGVSQWVQSEIGPGTRFGAILHFCAAPVVVTEVSGPDSYSASAEVPWWAVAGALGRDRVPQPLRQPFLAERGLSDEPVCFIKLGPDDPAERFNRAGRPWLRLLSPIEPGSGWWVVRSQDAESLCYADPGDAGSRLEARRLSDTSWSLKASIELRGEQRVPGAMRLLRPFRQAVGVRSLDGAPMRRRSSS